MFKALLLQSWHSLSDPELEEALRVRIDFMLFTGMGIENEVPDETTICRFRNKLDLLRNPPIQNRFKEKLPFFQNPIFKTRISG